MTIEARRALGWTLASLVAVLALLLILGACAPAPQLHGRAAFDRWIAEHVTSITHEPITFAAAYYNPIDRSVHYDDAQIAAFYNANPGDADWVDIHEKAHAVAFALDLFIHTDDPGSHPEPCDFQAGCPSAERAAQCITEVVLGHDPTWTYPDTGYWDCPADQVASAEALMQLEGAW